MLVRSRTIAAPLLVRHPTLPCAARARVHAAPYGDKAKPPVF